MKWMELSEILNSNGPPKKDIEKWKQVRNKNKICELFPIIVNIRIITITRLFFRLGSI